MPHTPVSEGLFFWLQLVQSWIQEIMNSEQGSFVVSAKFREDAIDVEALAVRTCTHAHTTYTHAHIRTCATQRRFCQAFFQRFQRESLVR